MTIRIACGRCLGAGTVTVASTMGLLLLVLVSSAAAQPAEKAVLIPFNGVIDPMSEAMLMRRLDRAEKLQASTIILQIDSPGGSLHSTEMIAQRLRDMDAVRTVAYIPRQALSGAALLSLVCDEIVMHPKAVLGDAGPIIQQGGFQNAPEKIVTHVATIARDYAESTGRPGALAEAMVDFDMEVFSFTNVETGEQRFMGLREWENAGGEAVWKKGNLVRESRDGVYLEVTGERAVELGLANHLVNNERELQDYLGLTEPPQILKATAVDYTVQILNSPLATGLLFLIGLIALFVELSAPGIGVGGLISGLCFTLFFWSRALGGTSGWLEVTLFLLGIVFLGMELFVIPGFGFAGVAGILMLLASVVMASIEGHFPDSTQTWVAAGKAAVVFVVAGAAGVLGLMIFGERLGSVPVFGRLVLRPPSAEEVLDPKNPQAKVSVGWESPVSVGDWGVAETPLRPAGRALFEDESVDVMADGTYVDVGTQVRVIRVDGNQVVVRAVV